MAANNTNPKSELVTFLQRKIGRALTKTDTVYECQQNGELWQCTLKLPCHQGEEFAGELAPTEKEAQQSAAAQALALYSAEFAALPPAPTKKKEKKPAQAAQPNMQGALNALNAFAVAAPTQEADNFKTQLMQQMQKHCARAMTKTDIIYESAKIGETGGFQATVRLACCGGQEFVGEVANDTKAAQQSAAQQALMNSHMWMPGTAEALAPAADNKRKTPDPSSQNPKSELISFMQRYLGRTLEKNDLLYQSNETVGGTQATVQLTCFQNRQFAGEVCAGQKLAEAAAAYQALVALTAELGEPGPAAKKKKKSGSSGGQTTPGQQQTVAAFQQTMAKFQKFMGGAGMPGMAGFGGAQKGIAQKGGAQMLGAQRGGLQMGGLQKGAGKPQLACGKGAPMQQMACGKGQGKAMGAQAPVAPRTFITKEPILGEIETWNEAGGFGWIRPGAVINHPEAQKRQGKIYVNRKDVTPGQPIGQGSMVQFRVYTDNKGLGACEVMPF